MRSFPSLKDKKRYLVFEIISEKTHSFEEVKTAVFGAVASFLGTSGIAKSKLKVLADKWNSQKQRGILSADRKSIEHVKAALCLSDNVGESSAIIRSIGVSGIIKKAVKNYY